MYFQHSTISANNVDLEKDVCNSNMAGSDSTLHATIGKRAGGQTTGIGL